jgi:flagellar basal-body rod protein FlgB
MSIGFDQALGTHEKALQFRSQRAALLSENLANADTPNYKARDVSFQQALKQAASNSGSRFTLDRTANQHIAAQGQSGADGVFYRIPTQPSIDGNTVETHVEQTQFARNAQDFQVSFTLLNSKFRGLMTAIRGD